MFGKEKNNQNNIGEIQDQNIPMTSQIEGIDLEDDGFSDFFNDDNDVFDNISYPSQIENNQIQQQYNQIEEVNQLQEGNIQPQEYAQPQEEYAQPQQEYVQPQQEYVQPQEEYVQPQEEYTQQEYNQPAQESENIKRDMVLYIIADKKENGLTTYFRECGIKVSSVYDDITEAKNAVLMQSLPTRIVIIDSGKGKFTLTKVREEIIDMLGISDEQNKTTVFFTDSVIKVDTMRALGKAAKQIDWLQYKSTPIVAATILAYRENYVYDMEDEADEIADEKTILSMEGFKYRGEESERMGVVGITPKAVLDNIVNEDGTELEGFVINL